MPGQSLGFVGLGRMGGGIARRLLRAGHEGGRRFGHTLQLGLQFPAAGFDLGPCGHLILETSLQVTDLRRAQVQQVPDLLELQGQFFNLPVLVL
jgi:hypothetical protein